MAGRREERKGEENREERKGREKRMERREENGEGRGRKEIRRKERIESHTIYF